MIIKTKLLQQQQQTLTTSAATLKELIPLKISWFEIFPTILSVSTIITGCQQSLSLITANKLAGHESHDHNTSNRQVQFYS